MLIKIPQPWQLSESSVTPEQTYLNRRQLLALAALPSIAATRNPDFTAGRPLTEEWAAISYNNYYEFSTNKQEIKDLAKSFKPRPWTLEIKGHCAKPQTFSIEDLEKRMPIEERVYRHRCVEAWAMTVPWLGFPLAHLIKLAQPNSNAKYVRFVTVNRPDEMPGIRYSGNYPWPYYEGIRMDEAMNPLAFMVTGIYGKPLPNQNGAPIRVALPWKYGFKSSKAIVQIEFVDKKPATFWNVAVPSEYGFYANVNPKRPHPRWSQAVEQLIPNMERVATKPYNGYEKWVTAMYNGTEI